MATLSQIGIPGVGFGILMPKLKNRWVVTFRGIGSGAAPSGDLSWQCKNITRPSLSFEKVKLDRYNSIAYVAGKHEWEECNITLEDDITGLATSVIQSQLEMQQELIGASGLYLAAAATASSYKFGTVLDLLDGGENIVEQWLLEGCWISKSDYGELDYTASEAVTINLSLSFDHARQIIGPDLPAGTAIGGTL